MKKRTKNGLVLFALLNTITFLGACHASPNGHSVVSKNDGAFDINVAQSAEETHAHNATQKIVFYDDFSSTDGSVEFAFSINQTITASDMPVVEVSPHFLTESDAERAARAVFGNNALFYEAEPTMNVQFSKEEIQEQIARWAPYTTEQAIANLYGGQNGSHKDDADTIKAYIEHLTLSVYPNAPSGNFRNICNWKFQNESVYFYGSGNEERTTSSRENQQIQAWTKVGSYYYNFQATRRNEIDYKLNNIYVNPVFASPLDIDYELLKAEKLRTDYPTSDQIEFAKKKAQRILDDIGLGEWIVDQAYVETFQDGDTSEYTICVNAVPVFNNSPVVRRPQINNLKSATTFASNYYLTDSTFRFSANGDLILFSMFSPVDVLNIVNNNVSTIPIETLLSSAKEHLRLSDYYAYGYGEIADTIPEDILCKVELCTLEYGLTRVKVPNTDERYYYLPALFIKGTIEYIGENSKNIYYSTSSILDEPQLLLIINAIDGSIINVTNE